MRPLIAFVWAASMLAQTSEPVATMPDPAMLAEDVAWNPRTRALYVSSVHLRKILWIDRKGKLREFTAERQNGAWGILALGIDVKRQELWASTAAVPQALGVTPAETGQSALLRYQVKDGRLTGRHEIPKDGKRHLLGDLTVSPSGVVYVSDATGAVYKCTADTPELEILLPQGTFRSPQTPALSSDGQTLFVADYSKGIAAVELKSRAVSWLEAPAGSDLRGIDGLYELGRALIGIQNGSRPARILRLPLDSGGRRITAVDVLESGAHLGEPTHGVLTANGFVYIANSGWNYFAADGSLKPDAKPERAMLRRLKLR